MRVLPHDRVPAMLQTAALASFVRQHVVLRTDTLQMLAVRHGTDVPGLKRVNNLMTEHSLHSRSHLFIPGVCRAWAYVSAAGVLRFKFRDCSVLELCGAT